MSVATAEVRTAEVRTGRSTRPKPTTKSVVRAGAIATVAAAVATELFAQAAKAVGVSMDVAGKPIPFGGFAVATLIWSAVGTVLAVVLARRAKRPAPTFVVTAVVLTALSFAAPLTTHDTATSTVVTLALSHVVAAAIVIPALALRLTREG